ncbi:methyl-accepting chemotaxis protein [Bacillus manliponensis]|uniref:methyl-accepting chemotaxis protein n=1 Tax=Bacillus manliponensis TaxID=574376 RepID=UPI003517A801
MKFLSKISITKKLIISFLIILTVPSFVIGGMSYTTAKENFEKQTMLSMSASTTVLNGIIDQQLGAKATDVDYFASIFSASSYAAENVEATRMKLAEYISIHPEVEGIYIGGADKTFIREPNLQMPDGYDPTERTWYQEAIQKSGQLIITAPYESSSTKNMVVTIAKQTPDGQGVVGLNLNLESITKLTKMIQIGEKGYAIVLDQNQQVVSHPSIKGGKKIEASWATPIYEKDNGTVSYKENGDEKKLSFTTNKKTGWKTIAVMFEDEVAKAAEPVFLKTLMIVIIAVMSGSALIYFMTLSITKPLGRIVTSAKKISDGDLTEEIPVHSKDEIGQLAESFNDMAASLRNVILQMNESSGRLAASSEELTASVNQANDATEEITTAMDQVASGAQSQSEGVEEGVALLQEVNKAIMHVTQSSETISTSSTYARQKAEEGGAYVEQTVSQMESIHQSVTQSDDVIKLLDEKSKQIGAILEVIQSIAQQTNLLALNAAIEAARAGEHGRGFAIVADEVRKLAEQTGQSSGEVAKLITEITADIHGTVKSMGEVKHEVQHGIEVVQKTKTSFVDILKVTNEIVSQITTMTTTTKHMGENANDVTNAIDEIAAAAEENTVSVQNVAASSEEQMHSMQEISSAAKQLSHMAEELQSMIEQFKLK